MVPTFYLVLSSTLYFDIIQTNGSSVSFSREHEEDTERFCDVTNLK
jgi:hypothetical protein